MLKVFKQYFFDERERHFLWLPVLFGLGISLYFLWPFAISSIWLILLFELTLVLMFFRRFHTGQMMILACFLTVLAGFSYITLYTTYQASHVQLLEKQETLYLTGRVARIEQMSGQKARLWLKNVSDFDKQRQGIYRLVGNNRQNFKEGDCVEMVASLMRPSSPLQPGGFLFERQAFYQGISAVGYAVSTIYKTDCGTEPDLMTKVGIFFNQARKNISKEIAEILPKDEAGVASAVLVGDKSMLTPDLYAAYRSAGLAHFLAISGLHIGFMAALAFFAVRLVFAVIPKLTLRYDSKIAGSVFAICCSFGYLLLSGANVPALRAFLMTTVVFLGVMMGREAISMRTVAFAAFVILLFEPYAILSAGFQMSFAAVVALVAFYETIKVKKGPSSEHSLLRKIYRYFMGVMLTTLVATLAVMPYTLYHFSAFAPYAVLTNLLAAPLIAFVVMPCVFLSLILWPVGWHVFFLTIAGWGFWGLNRLVREIVTFPYADKVCESFSLLGLVLVTIGGLWLCLWTRKWRFLGIVPILLGFLSYAMNEKPDILYSSDGFSVGIKKSDEVLTVFSAKKKKFLFETWGRNYQNVEIIQEMQNVPEIGVICDEKMCIYQDVFAFDLSGYLSLHGVKLEPQKTLGGAIWINEGKIKHVPVQKTRGLKPWNMRTQ